MFIGPPTEGFTYLPTYIKEKKKKKEKKGKKEKRSECPYPPTQVTATYLPLLDARLVGR